MAKQSSAPTGRHARGSWRRPPRRSRRRKRSSRDRSGRADRHHRRLSELGCWTPHVEITRPAFVTLDVFQHADSSRNGTATRTSSFRLKR
jgi:hypothetical protein